MEELYELRTYIETGKYQEALLLLDEMEEMSLDDKITRISSFMEVLLVHLIKQAVEKRTTRSWDVSIRNALRQIMKLNKRRKAGGWYLTEEELYIASEEAYASALDSAALEALGGQYTTEEISAMIDRPEMIRWALQQMQPVASANSRIGILQGIVRRPRASASGPRVAVSGLHMHLFAYSAPYEDGRLTSS